ncbi:class E sortase [Arsenicicoccus dermatophilus]|uniref:class E sortase n=1 Tax=Arsenicicoccus dermatophilus TaxID=1076331 RepID=UPI0030C69C4F
MRTARGIIGALGELLITLGVITVLFVGWQLVWTDVAANAAHTELVDELGQDFAQGISEPAKVPHGKAFAIVRIPALGADYRVPLIEGTDRAVLRRGIGHYEGTAMPGQIGNFAIAGHRMTYGGPFRDIERVLPGDRVVVETAQAWYVYKVGPHTLVDPSHIAAIDPMPERPGVKPDRAYITLTACHPKYAAKQRWIVHGVLEKVVPHEQGPPKAYLAVPGGR